MENKGFMGRDWNGIPSHCGACGASFGSLDHHKCPPESLKFWKELYEHGNKEEIDRVVKQALSDK